MCLMFGDISDGEVLETFARLNTYAVKLNAQELRNGRFFGLFKQSAYTLAFEHVEFWRRNGIFSERNIARMLEVELTSELLIALLDGLQDKKNRSTDSIARTMQGSPTDGWSFSSFETVLKQSRKLFRTSS